MQPLSRLCLPEIEGVTNSVSSFHVPLGNRAIETQNSRCKAACYKLLEL